MCQEMRPMSALEDFKDKRDKGTETAGGVTRGLLTTLEKDIFEERNNTQTERRDKDEKLTFQHPVLTTNMSQHSSDRE